MLNEDVHEHRDVGGAKKGLQETIGVRKKMQQSYLVGDTGVSIRWGVKGNDLKEVTAMSPDLRTLKTYWVSKGSAFSTSISKQETDLSPEMISR